MNEALRFGSAAPWLAPYRDDAQRVQGLLERGAGVAQALNACLDERGPVMLGAGTLRFVDAAAQPPGEAYEAFIARTARVPTRDNLHDLFNGLVWLDQPALKRRLNEWQAAEIAAHGIGARRGALRDALTVFDENGALLQAPTPLVEALRRHDWQAAFGSLRSAWRDAELTLVGHALLEKLTAPRKAITAHVLVLGEGGDPWGRVLARRGAQAAASRAERPFVPLPVLGVPGWWPENEDSRFYADLEVFRPIARTKKNSGPQAAVRRG